MGFGRGLEKYTCEIKVSRRKKNEDFHQNLPTHVIQGKCNENLQDLTRLEILNLVYAS